MFTGDLTLVQISCMIVVHIFFYFLVNWTSEILKVNINKLKWFMYYLLLSI